MLFDVIDAEERYFGAIEPIIDLAIMGKNVEALRQLHYGDGVLAKNAEEFSNRSKELKDYIMTKADDCAKWSTDKAASSTKTSIVIISLVALAAVACSIFIGIVILTTKTKAGIDPQTPYP